jgi:DNA-directed RNA polymerase specialized sigma24 family protein
VDGQLKGLVDIHDSAAEAMTTSKIEETSSFSVPLESNGAGAHRGGALMEMGMPGLVDAARHGDREAFEALVRAGSGRLYAIAYRILRDADLANDALQEALVRFWDDLPTLRDPDQYDPLTYRITCRACYRVAKRERRTSVATLVERMTPESSAFESGPSGQVSRPRRPTRRHCRDPHGPADTAGPPSQAAARSDVAAIGGATRCDQHERPS